MPRYFKRDKKFDEEEYPYPTWLEITKKEADAIDPQGPERVIETPTSDEIYQEAMKILDECSLAHPDEITLIEDVKGAIRIHYSGMYFSMVSGANTINSEDDLITAYSKAILYKLQTMNKETFLAKSLRAFCQEKLGLLLPENFEGESFVIQQKQNEDAPIEIKSQQDELGETISRSESMGFEETSETKAQQNESDEVILSGYTFLNPDEKKEIEEKQDKTEELILSRYLFLNPDETSEAKAQLDVPDETNKTKTTEAASEAQSFYPFLYNPLFETAHTNPRETTKKIVKVYASERYQAMTGLLSAKELFPESLLELLEMYDQIVKLDRYGPLTENLLQRAIQYKISQDLFHNDYKYSPPRILDEILSSPNKTEIITTLFEQIAILIAHAKNGFAHTFYMGQLSAIVRVIDPDENFFSRLTADEPVLIATPRGCQIIIDELRKKHRIPDDLPILMVHDADTLESVIKNQLKISNRFAIIFCAEQSFVHYTPIWVQRSAENPEHYSLLVTDSLGLTIAERKVDAGSKTPPPILSTIKSLKEEGLRLRASVFASLEENLKRLAKKDEAAIFIHTKQRQADGMNCFTLAVRDIVELAKIKDPISQISVINHLSDIGPGFHFVAHIHPELLKTTQLKRRVSELHKDNPSLRDVKMVTRKKPQGETLSEILERKTVVKEVVKKDSVEDAKARNVRLEMKGIKYIGMFVGAYTQGQKKSSSSTVQLTEIDPTKKIIVHFMALDRGILNFCGIICVLNGMPFFKAITITPKFGDEKRPATFFPFRGILDHEEHISTQTFGPGYYIKAYKPEELFLEKRFPQLILDFIATYQKHPLASQGTDYYDEIARFGNFEYMVVSMLLGGGIWENEQGKCLKEFIMQSFSDYVLELKKLYKDDIETIKGIIESEDKFELKYLPTATTSNPQAENVVSYSGEQENAAMRINRYLIAQGCDKEQIGQAKDLNFTMTAMPLPAQDHPRIAEFLDEYAKRMILPSGPGAWR